MSNVEKYSKFLSNLSVKITNGEPAPNKSIMLLSVMDLIRCGYIADNKILLEDTIQEAFDFNWRKFVNEKTPSAWTPFWHLKKEPFWHFVAKVGKEDCIENLVPKGNTASVGKMREVIQYARIDDDLFSLLKDERSRTQIREVLINTYLSDNIPNDTNAHSRPTEE